MDRRRERIRRGSILRSLDRRGAHFRHRQAVVPPTTAPLHILHVCIVRQIDAVAPRFTRRPHTR
jgi:hypothetical protein